MTQHEHFKRRVRERMASTGERYAAARRVLIDQAPAHRRRRWVSEPEHTDEVIIRQTGRSWDDWCDKIDEWIAAGSGDHADGNETSDDTDPVTRRNHTAIAAFVYAEHDFDHWWSQGVTVGYERIVGLRLPHQMSDGTFTANKSMTVAVDRHELRAMLLDESDRHQLFGGRDVELRSKPTSKSIRLGIEPGVALFTLDSTGDGRTKVTVSHEKLPSSDDVAEWQFYWAERLSALDDR